MDVTYLEQWIGKTEIREELIAAFPSNALAATLDRSDPDYTTGSPLPPLWHWLHFLPVFKLADAGYDGHAALGGFLPPVPLPRRMWAGSRLTFVSPMPIGSHLRKVSTIKSVKAKSGRSGQLVFVNVGHQVFEGDRLGIDEEHDIVYREEATKGASLPTPVAAPTESNFFREIDPNPVLLFRYSALTFNGHRIHYDHPFCIGSEAYQGLVVHGPLIATLLLDLLRREQPDVRISAFEFRAISTIFDTEPFWLHGEPAADGKTYHLWARRSDGALAMDATAVVE
ncbi:acyl-CoA dehydrogenase [uncultured Cohaesibacter sp.]|uniref:acyl-CoA dehydrogenase n=1 Tax=uncultured Cohaesibacter sp. TaxID=1002546 RepID=UPI0029C728BF|nr:acyl-CoA dehydrogenase [uncultured Cohaesibacter sp.]